VAELEYFWLQPAGAMVLENCIAAEEEVADFPFAFSLTFKGEGDRCHLFSGRSRENICRWVTAINCGSYSYWRRKLEVLQTELISVTGKVSGIFFKVFNIIGDI